MKPLLITLFCLCSFSVFAQNLYSIKGTVIDTAQKAKLTNTTVAVLNAKDSILRAFVWANENGNFFIDKLPKGKFILLVTYLGYADYVDNFTLDSINKEHDFKNIDMILKSRLLADVIIKGKAAAIKIKGDTTEFNARSYVIQPNDKVEDLLRQLPGIQVDKDGKITAQGQTVSKVLVDGEEFFGDDPTLVTKNIRADMVDKVQLYDKKSDQATFTGIDDGKTTKTINIKLREDKKNGEFGKVNANLGTDGYYEDQLLFNRFKAKEKFALYGTAANDGRTGIGFQDSNSLGINNDAIQFVDGGIQITSNNNNDALDSFSGYYDGKGIPVTQSGGVHYDSKFNNDKESLNTNYKVGAIDVTGTTTSTVQQTLPTGVVNTYSNENFSDYAFRQKLDAAYKIKLDTSSDLKISADATFKNFHVNNDYQTVTDSDNVMLNKENRSVINHGDQQIFDASAFYTKKFKKKGRTLSWVLSEAYNKSTSEGYLNSEIDFYHIPNSAPDSVQTLNQYKTTNSVSSDLNTNITYSEPFTSKISLLVNYGVAMNNSTNNRQTFDESSPGIYNIFDNAYSNDYKFNQLTNQEGAIFNYQYKKAIFNFGTKVSEVNFKQTDEYTGNVLERNFLNWAPQAMYMYKFSQFKALRITYNGNNTEPTIDQIQPVLINNDPLNITIGNPELKPSFTNKVNLFYNSYQVLSGQQFFISGNFSNTYDAIVNNTTFINGKNTIRYVNLDGQDPYNYSVYASLGKKIDRIDLQAGLNVNTSGSVSYSYIDNALDMGKSYTYSGGIYFNKYVQKKYDFYVTGGPSYTISTMSLQALNNNAAGFNTNGRFDLYLPLKFGAGSDVRYTYNAATQAFSAEHLTIWNAYIYKTFLKDDKLKISLSGNDLLNQNVNFTRGINGNTTTQTNTTGIKRFFMLSVTWDFTKFGTVKAQQ